MIRSKDDNRFPRNVRWHHARNGHIAPRQLFETSQAPRRFSQMVQVLLRLHGKMRIERLNLGHRGFE
jgi:hypothetical protein